MSPKIMIGISVVLSALAQIFLKYGLTRAQKNRAGRPALMGLLIGVIRQEFVWLLGLQKLELSYAYPLVSFGYVLVSILSALFFHERVDGNRWAAIAVISIGVMLIAGS
jgi:undecaprenyl phosphate-alpha-L-ara4N flippase subunit ArnE